jgi:hypothetical protein
LDRSTSPGSREEALTLFSCFSSPATFSIFAEGSVTISRDDNRQQSFGMCNVQRQSELLMMVGPRNYVGTA